MWILWAIGVCVCEGVRKKKLRVESVWDFSARNEIYSWLLVYERQLWNLLYPRMGI